MAFIDDAHRVRRLAEGNAEEAQPNAASRIDVDNSKSAKHPEVAERLSASRQPSSRRGCLRLGFSLSPPQPWMMCSQVGPAISFCWCSWPLNRSGRRSPRSPREVVACRAARRRHCREPSASSGENRVVSYKDLQAGARCESFRQGLELPIHELLGEHGPLRQSIAEAEDGGVGDVYRDPWRQSRNGIVPRRHAPCRRRPGVGKHWRRVSAEDIEEVFVADALEEVDPKSRVIAIEPLGKHGCRRCQSMLPASSSDAAESPVPRMKSGGSRSAVSAMASATLACPSSPEPKSPTTKNRSRDCSTGLQ